VEQCLGKIVGWQDDVQRLVLGHSIAVREIKLLSKQEITIKTPGNEAR
jgi:hypothetical protein